MELVAIPWAWFSSAGIILNPVSSLIFDVDYFNLGYLTGSLFWTILLVFFQLVILAVLIRIARGLITYKEQGRT